MVKPLGKPLVVCKWVLFGGHGAYQAPDWTADWLHRELTNWLDITANQEFGKNFSDLNDEQQTLLKARLTKEYRGSKVENGTVVLSNTRLAAMEKQRNTTSLYTVMIQQPK